MKYIHLNFLIIGAFLLILQTGSAQSYNCDRQAVVDDYTENIINTEITPGELDWTGNASGCEAGIISATAKTNTLKRINYFRRLAGVSDDIVFDTTKNKKSQETALMIKANNNINYNPPSSWLCYTADGDEAASRSLQAIGVHAVNAIPFFIESKDEGTAVFRRWILYHRKGAYGVGSTDNTTALWAIDYGDAPETVPEYIAYPAPGYFPKPLVYVNWSFSIPGANFSNTTIQMYNELNNPVSLTKYDAANGMGDNSIVWNPDIDLNATINGSDLLFTVKVNDVLIGEDFQDFEYQVLIIEPTTVEPEITSIEPECGENNGSISVEYTPGYSDISWSNGQSGQKQVNDLQAGTYTLTITDKLGCTITETITLQQQKAEVNAQITPEEDTVNICAGETVTLTAGGGDNYQWANGSSTASVTADAQGIYSVTVSSDEGCYDTASVFVKVHPLPVADTIKGDTTPDPDIPVIYEVQQNTGASYKWSIIGGEILSGIDSAAVKVSWFNQADPAELCVTEINEYNCESEALCMNVHIIATDIGKPGKSESITFFPNPVENMLQIRLSAPEVLNSPLELSLFSLAGEKVLYKTEAAYSGNTILDLSRLQAGTYFLKVLTGDIASIHKIVKL